MADKSPDFTIGIEEEYLVVDRSTLNLVTRMPPALMEECTEALGSQVVREFLQCQIEVGTKVCETVQQARKELVYLRKTVSEIVQKYDCMIMACSTHPYSYGLTQQTENERYRAISEELQRVIQRLYISGMHIHVGINDNEQRIDLMNQLTYILPHILALSTSSPFWRGENTGLKSYRVSVFDELPRTGLPPQFYSYTDYIKHVDVLVNTGIIENPSKIWWDLRPSFRFPTLELRIADMCTNVDDTIAIAAAYRCWVRMLCRLRLNNQRWRQYSDFLIRENRWRAQRYGIDKGLLDFGRGEIISCRDLYGEFVDLVHEDAEYFGCVKELEHIFTILDRGTSAHRQIAVFDKSIANGTPHQLALVNVVKFILEETLVGINDDT